MLFKSVFFLLQSVCLSGCFSQLQITFSYHQEHPASHALMHFTCRGDFQISSACATCSLPASSGEKLQLKNSSSERVGRQHDRCCLNLIRRTCFNPSVSCSVSCFCVVFTADVEMLNKLHETRLTFSIPIMSQLSTPSQISFLYKRYEHLCQRV